jgi:hypothetical protein
VLKSAGETAAQVSGLGVQCLCVDTLNGSCRITAPI